eukprot:409586-Rhodomonas_salina.2
MTPGDIIQVTLPASKEFPETPQPSQPSELVARKAPVAKNLLKDIDVYGIQIVFTNRDEPIDIDHHARRGRMTYTDTNRTCRPVSVRSAERWHADAPFCDFSKPTLLRPARFVGRPCSRPSTPSTQSPRQRAVPDRYEAV